jgi:molecular chaperone HscB
MTSLDSNFARADHFALLGLPRAYAIDRDRLEAAYHAMQDRVHPDKHAHSDDADRRLAMQWATQANEAYRTLRNPLLRARYLLELAGHDARIETNTAMPSDFLVQQMELRETVAAAREAGDATQLDALHGRIRSAMAAQHEELRKALDETNDLGHASDIVRQLMFQEKLFSEIDDALTAVDA